MIKRMFAILLALCISISSGNILAFAMESNEVDNLNETGVTRIEWLQGLTSAFQMSVEENNYPDNYYSDINSEYEFYYEVMLATEFGLVDIEAGDPFCPDMPATREFVAHTLNVCMGFSYNDDIYSFEEAEFVTYPNDIEVAIQQGWFAISDDCFLPEAQITEDEKEALLLIAQTEAKERIIDVEHENSYQFQPDVIVIPENVTVEMQNPGVYSFSEILDTVDIGDKIAFFIDGFPVVKKVSSISESSESVIVSTVNVETEDAYVNVDYEGILSGNLAEVQIVDSEDIELTYVLGGTPQNEYRDGLECESIGVNNKERVTAVRVTKSYDASEYVEFPFGPNDSGTLKLTYTISNPKVDYKLNMTNPYINFDTNISLSCDAEIELLEAVGASTDIIMAKIPVAGIGFMEVALTFSAAGDITLNLSEDVSMGVKWSEANGFQMTKKFSKKSFTLQANVEVAMGIKAAVGFDVVILEGEVFGELGVKNHVETTQYSDEVSPSNCTHISGYFYAELGCGIELDLGIVRYGYEIKMPLYDEDNSPIRLVFHFEDGRKVYSCTRKNYKYLTSPDSKYGCNVFHSGVFEYEHVTADTIRITKYNGHYSSIRVPETLDDYTVVEIGDEAFIDHGELKMIVLPNTIKKIGKNAFEWCSYLETVVLPEGLTTIDDLAFMFCYSLKNINLPKSLTTLGSNAFHSCGELEEIFIPKALEVNECHYPFYWCDKLSTVYIEEGITRIPGSLFWNCTGLKEIVIPETVTSIGYGAFFGSGLETVVLPQNLREIHSQAFENCAQLKEVVLPKSLNYLGGEAFANCDELEKINIPRALSEIDDVNGTKFGPFSDCDKLNTIVFEDDVTVIIAGLFGGCSGLQEIRIPGRIKTIENGAFVGCPNLKTVVLEEGVETIGDSFTSCKKLESVTIPKSVSDIVYRAFDNSTGNMVIYCLKNSYAHNYAIMCEYVYKTKIIPIEEIELDITEAQLKQQSTLQLKTICTPTLYSDTITWKSSDESMATVSEDGLVTVYDEVGEVVISATSESGRTSCCYITIVPDVYSISYILNDGTNHEDNPYSFSIDQTIVLQEPTKHGYKFKGWYLDENFETPISVIQRGSKRDYVLYAKWEVALYTITYELNGGESNGGNFEKYRVFDTITLLDGFWQGHTFEGWYLDEDFSTRVIQVDTNAAKDITLYAKWSLNVYNIFYELNGGKNCENNPLTYTVEDETIILEAPMKEGYVFRGWSDNSHSFREVTEITKGSTIDRYMYAYWDANTYNIAFDGNGNTSGIMQNISNCLYDESYELWPNTYVKDGYVFTGWNTMANGKGISYSDSSKVKNITAKNGVTVILYAQWKPITSKIYSINYVLNGGVNHKSNPTKYDCKGNTILYAPTRSGYNFEGWYTEKAFVNKVTQIIASSVGDKTLYAKWSPNIYHLSFNANGATSGYMANLNNCKYDALYSLTTNAYKRTGYIFTGWNTKPDGTGVVYTDRASIRNLTAENGKTITLYAQWTSTKYKITYKLNGGKNSKSNKTSYYVTTATFKLKNPTRKGYTFKGWYSDKKCTKKVTQIKKGSTGDKTLYAKWAKTKYKITYVLNKGKNNKGNKKTYYVTTYTFKLKNPTRKGYVFKGWYSNKKCTKKITKIKKGSTGNIKLYAKWVKKK